MLSREQISDRKGLVWGPVAYIINVYMTSRIDVEWTIIATRLGFTEKVWAGFASLEVISHTFSSKT